MISSSRNPAFRRRTASERVATAKDSIPLARKTVATRTVSMAVSIRFHHTGDLDTGSDLLLDLLDIKVQISNIDLSPGCA